MPYSVRPKQTLSMHTRDGVRLDADVYYPDAPGEFPVLLMRQPYGRAIASTVVYAHPSWYAAHGYIVVIQDVRGRGSSEGVFDLFAHEIADGEDTVNWAATLPQSDGQVGMYGFSYQGMTQLYATATRPAALKTLCPSMAAYDLYHDWAYEGGAFGYQLNLGWALQLAAETARRQGNAESYGILYAAARTSPLSDPVSPHSDLLKQLAPDSHYHAWVKHSQPDAYWQNLSPKTYLSQVNLPMLHIGGWFDTFLRGTLNLYRHMVLAQAAPQFLLVGPWSHLPWGRQVGSFDYGPEANSPVDRLQIRWFAHFLKGEDTGLLAEPPVWLFEMGTNQWQKFAAWPTPTPSSYFLASTGLAAIDDRSGSLTSAPASSPTCDMLVHDPWRPVPAIGGHAASPAGPGDRAAVDSRSDVLTYTSAPLETDLRLAGEIWLELVCSADTVSYDICAVLSQIKPNGKVYSFSQGYLRIDEEATRSPTRRTIVLQSTCICIPQGDALRLSISAACAPAYLVNPGTGAAPVDSHLIEAQVTTVSVLSGEGDQLTQLFLPGS
jgi:hypothetical protein